MDHEPRSSAGLAAGAAGGISVRGGHEPHPGYQPRGRVEGHRGPAAGGLCGVLRPQPGLPAGELPRPAAGGGAVRPAVRREGGFTAGVSGHHRFHQHRVQAPGDDRSPRGAGGHRRGADRRPGPAGTGLPVPQREGAVPVRPVPSRSGAGPGVRLHSLGGGGGVRRHRGLLRRPAPDQVDQ